MGPSRLLKKNRAQRHFIVRRSRGYMQVNLIVSIYETAANFFSFLFLFLVSLVVFALFTCLFVSFVCLFFSVISQLLVFT